MGLMMGLMFDVIVMVWVCCVTSLAFLTVGRAGSSIGPDGTWVHLLLSYHQISD